MSKKRITWTIVLLAVVIGGWYAYKEYTRKNKDLSKVKADIEIAPNALIKDYETDDSLANIKYLDKIIELNGLLKEVNKDESGDYTLVFGETASMSSVRCSMDTTHQQDASRLQPGSSIVVRGACTGFIRDEMGLGSDVIMNRCVIIQKKN